MGDPYHDKGLLPNRAGEYVRREREAQKPRLRGRLEQEKRFDEVEKRLARAYAHLRGESDE